jgi:hypothetical protein
MSGKPLPLACCRFLKTFLFDFYNPLKTIGYAYFCSLAQALLCCR